MKKQYIVLTFVIFLCIFTNMLSRKYLTPCFFHAFFCFGGVRYTVVGNTVFDAYNRKHIFSGINRPSLEWSKQGENLSLHDYDTIHSWGANIIRLPVNQQFWLTDAAYRHTLEQNIHQIQSLKMDVIIDLHWSDKGSVTEPPAQQKMADVESLLFWKQIAQQYKSNGGVLFELYNEPHDISPTIWRNGGMLKTETNINDYYAVGMQQMTDTIRSTGAENIIIINGLNWGYDLHGLTDIQGINIMYGTHPYNFEGKNTEKDWESAFGSVSLQVPIILTEYGDTADCNGVFDKKILEYAQMHTLSTIAWAWFFNPNDPQGCDFPSVILNWNYDPTPAGIVVKKYLLSQTGQNRTQ